jgi:hypothetical protein
MSAPSPNAPASPEVAQDSPDTDNELHEEDAGKLVHVTNLSVNTI